MAQLSHQKFVVDNVGEYQPKRKNNWYMQITPPGSTTIQAVEIKSAGLPGGEFSEIEIKYMNSKYYFPGIWTWDTIEVTLRDFVGSRYSTTEKLYNWFLNNYDPQTGGQNMGTQIKTPISIKLLSPRGELIETWTLNGAWLKAAKWGDVSYEEDGPRELTVTIRYDYATLQSETVPTAFNTNLDATETSDSTSTSIGG